jgi:hypothetical protein
MDTLSEIEAKLQSLLEYLIPKSLPGRRLEDQVVQQLAAAMHSNREQTPDGLCAPNLYVVVANPLTLAKWNSKPRLLENLGVILRMVGTEAGFTFLVKPTVTTASDSVMPVGEIRVLASFSRENVEDTKGLPTEPALQKPAPNRNLENAFLVQDGSKIIALNQSIVNIGRRLDNQVVIDDPRISRVHAQVRVVKDRFVIFDLNSTGGTFVNGHRTSQSVLYPGDVISLAGVTLIFSQDLPGRRGGQDGDTEPGSPFSADRLTAILEPKRDKNK